jgi:hypothetical protein
VGWSVPVDDHANLAKTKTACRCSLQKTSRRVEFGSSRAKNASQKPYLSSPSAGSQRRGFWRPTLPNAGARRCLGWRDYDDSAVREKYYLATLGFFQLEFPKVVFVVSFPRRKTPISMSTSNMILIDVVPPTSTRGLKH